MSRDLTKRQDAFVSEFTKDGNATKAAIRAGYALSSARQRGYELVNNRDIQQRLQQAGQMALETLMSIASSGKNEQARVRAAEILMERAYGKVAPTTTHRTPDITINFSRVDLSGNPIGS